MFRRAIFLSACLSLSACTSGAGPCPAWVAEFNKAGRDKNTVFPGGTGVALYGIPTRAEAYASANGNKGKKGSSVG